MPLATVKVDIPGMAKEETKKSAKGGKIKKTAGVSVKKPKPKKAPVESEQRLGAEEKPKPTLEKGEDIIPEILEDKDDKRPDRYFEAVGRRKTSTARVRLCTRAGDFVVNQKPYGQYFPDLELQKIAEDALQKMKLFGRFRVSAKITGGGTHSQAEALRHGLARCLIKFNPDFRKRLKRAGYLRRDPRMKERKKFGLKKARRAPQWSKR